MRKWQVAMSKYTVWICCVLGLMTAHITVSAQTITGLYEATVVVKGRDRDTKNEGLQRALTQVLIKLSGNYQKFMQPEVQAELVNAYRWVQYFKFKTNPRDFQTLLTARFDREAVDQVLQEQKLPLWSAERPSFLGLVVVNTQNKQTILNEEQQPQFASLLGEKAQERGLPVLWPLLDLEDFNLFNANDIATFQQSALVKVGQRYGASAVLAGNVTMSANNTWQGNWQVYINNQQTNWQSEASSDVNTLLEQALNNGIDKIAEIILTKKTTTPTALPATNFIPPETGNQFELQVINVTDLNSYANVVSYLRSLDIIETLNVKYMDTQLVIFDVSVQGGNIALAQFIRNDGMLQPHDSGTQEPVYQWIK